MTDPRKPVFDAIRTARGTGFDWAEVVAIDNLLDSLKIGRATMTARSIGSKGLDLIKKWEGCRLKAYPDPGTGGKPWTIGWGSTTDENGKPIAPGTVWTQERADRRLEEHAGEFAGEVDRLIGNAPTSREQFDAMVSMAYNVGVGNFAGSTLLRKHKAGDHAGAAGEFGKWVYAAGRKLRGLENRRAEEAALYRAGS